MPTLVKIIFLQIIAVFALIGDWVYSYDTLTGEVSQQQVTSTTVLESDHINYLTIVDEQSREQVIETTDSHPFWVVTDDPDWSRAASDYVYENGVLLYHENLGATGSGYWVEAKDLREGDVFVGANGELSTLVSAERVEFPDGIKVYNFEVDGNHNYFVIAETAEYGQTCILVHNACWDGIVNDKNTQLVKAAKRKNAAIYQRSGGSAQAIADFNSLNPTNVKTYPNGSISGILPDGTHIDLHASTSMGGAMTLGIQTFPNAIKIRY